MATTTTAAADAKTPYDQLLDLVRAAGLLSATASLLSWDQETMMPPGGVDYRSRQLAQLASMVHGLRTDPRIGELLEACEADRPLTADPLSPSAVNLREIRREYRRATKLPAALVQELARTTTLAKHEWSQARKDNDFARFRPWLARIVDLSRQKADCFGWDHAGGERWDALAEGFEPGCTARGLEAVFTPLRQRLVRLLGALAGRSQPRQERLDQIRQLEVPVEAQKRFVRFVAQSIGFDFSRGRLDESAHPFCGGTHLHDVRMTSRYHPGKWLDALGSAMHESGHGIYGQNVPGGEDIDTPMGDPVSLAIHESQSRLWENQVGRSQAFWTWCQPRLAEHFGGACGQFTAQEVYAAANQVRPDLIRVEADEATYNLHIMVRFELERALMSGDLPVEELPAAWNRRYRDYLGVNVPDDARGCLQDIHWSMGAIGYFPTYTLGNLHAAQFFEQAQADLADLPGQLRSGEFQNLRQWLTRHIHSQGMRYRSEDLCRKVTGKPLSADPLLRHLEGKFRPLYGC